MIAQGGGTTRPADRRITSRAVRQSNRLHYLIAYCDAAEIEKTCRLDRIRAFHAAEM